MELKPTTFLRFVVKPGNRMLSQLMTKNMGEDKANVQSLAIALQESGLEHRRQIDSQGNPIDDLARGWWQFERAGGVEGVMKHSASASTAEILCAALCVPFNSEDVHEALAWNGPFAACFARLLLWTDAAPLPAVGDEHGAWDYYIRNWRPGKPHHETWAANYAMAVETVKV